MTTAYNADRSILLKAGLTVDVHIAQPSFYRAAITKGNSQLKLEWVRDTAFRFFPVLEDADFGYRLHDVDLMINKCLALANRSVVRDALDILDLDQRVMSLAGAVWAACGKDPGFTPDLLLEMFQRHSIFTPDLLEAEALTRSFDVKELKIEFAQLIGRTRESLLKLAAKDLGCVYVDASGNVAKDLRNLKKGRYRPHFGCVKGSWPRVVAD